jgi:RHS repeat-associated protein
LGKLVGYERIAGTTRARYYTAKDSLGSVTGTTDQGGELVGRREYADFDSAGMDGEGNEDTLEWYTGKEWDREAGLYYFNARWYEPETGRFTTEDPIRDQDNWYVYCGNNPLSRIDPTGLDSYDFYDSLYHGTYNANDRENNYEALMAKGSYEPPSLGGKDVDRGASPNKEATVSQKLGGFVSQVASGVSGAVNHDYGADQAAAALAELKRGNVLGGLVLSAGAEGEGLLDLGVDILGFAVDSLDQDSKDFLGFGLDTVGGAMAGEYAALSQSFTMASESAGLILDYNAAAAEGGGLFGPLNKGPLANDIADTFRSGTYTEVRTSKATTLYRVIGSGGNPAGSYWTRVAPSGPTQSIIDSALNPQWGNAATYQVRAIVPKGTTFYEGFAAPQGGLVGGGNQIYIPKVDPSWIQGIAGF